MLGIERAVHKILVQISTGERRSLLQAQNTYERKNNRFGKNKDIPFKEKNFPSNLTFCAPKVPKLLLIGGMPNVRA
jgi:hypothetical protein